MFRWHALSDTVQDQHHLNTRVTSATPHRLGEGVEDATALWTAVIEPRGAMPIVRFLTGTQRMPRRTVQTLWVQDLEPIVAAFLRIHPFLNWEK